MMDNLKYRTINGVLWSAAERASNEVLRFVIVVMLARLLSPEQFGLVAMLAIFIGISQTFVNSGFGAALIQKKNASQTDYSTVFYFNIIVGLFLFGILFCFAPFIAAFYQEPQLVALTRFMGLTIVISSFGLIQNTLLTKKIDFKTQTTVNMIALSCSGIIAIIMAWKGFGVWSLAVQAVSLDFFRTLLLWFFNSWRPTAEFSEKAFRSLFSYGSKLLAASLLNTIFTNIYAVVIGKAFTTTDLGFYTQANRLQRLPAQNVNSIVQRVTFPAFSSIQDENARLKRGYKKALKLLVFVNFPIMLGLIAVAKPLIGIVLTEKWMPAVPYLQLLCVVGSTYPIHSLNLNILQVKGRSDLFLKIQIIDTAVIALAIVLTLPFGILALIIGQVMTSFVAYFINSYYSSRFIGYGLGEQVTDILPYLSAAIIMAVSTALIGFFWEDQNMARLLFQIMSAIVVYSALSKIARLEAFEEMSIGFKAILLKTRLE